MRILFLSILFLSGLVLKSQTTLGWTWHGDSLFLKRTDTDSQCINYRQPLLISGTSIKTVNTNSLLGSGDINISSAVAWGNVTGTLSSQTDLQTALNGKQASITTGTTAQYFRGDLTLATFPTTTAAFTNSTNKNFVTDAQLTVIGNTSGTNSGDNAANSSSQPVNSNLTTIAGLTATTDNFMVAAASAWASRTPAQAKTSLSLNNVENTALSTWAGTTNITTLGTIATGTWNATAIADGKIASALTGKTYNGLTLTSTTGTFTLTNAKTLSVSNSLTLSGTDGTTMTFPSTSASISRNDAAQTFVGQNTFPGIIETGEGALTSTTSAIANTETKIMSSDVAMVASRLVVGSSILVTIHGTCTSTAAGAGTFRVRYGTAGTTSDGVMQAFTLAAAPTSGTSIPFTIHIIVTIRTTGASATSDGGLDLVNSGTTGLSATATQVVRGTATTINTTTAATFFTVTYISGNAATACTFADCTITMLNK